MPVVSGRLHAPEGFVFRNLTSHQDFLACIRLQELTWGQGFQERVPTAILRIASNYGGVLIGAFCQGEEENPDALVAFVFGLTGLQEGRLVHWSDMLAVDPGYRGQGLGIALKLAQRDQLLSLGVTLMHWSFDPLEALNARLNLNRLGAQGIAYVEDMYGASTSVLHKGIGTDRLIAAWDLKASAAAPEGRVSAPRAPTHLCVRVPIPRNLQRLKADEPSRALAWRAESRAVLASHLAQGWRVMRVEDSPEGSEALGVHPCLVLAPPSTF